MENVLKKICFLIQDYLNLKDNEIYIYNNKFFQSKEKGLNVCVGCNDSTVIANNNTHKEENEKYIEILETIIRSNIFINIYSYDNTAIREKEKIFFALNCDKAQEIQIKNNFKIFKISNNFISSPELDGTKVLNRFILNFQVIYKVGDVREVSYFDKFKNLLIKNN